MICIILSIYCYGDNIEVINGLKYEINDETKEATVVANAYTDIIVIPEKIQYKGDIYYVTKLAKRCFYECKNLKSVSIPSTIISLPQECFTGCNELTKISLPQSIQSIGYRCFTNCDGLSSITIPSSVKKIEMYCFSYCDKLEEISLPSSLTYLGPDCFSNCVSLKSIKIPDSITELYGGTFEDCINLVSVSIPNSVTLIAASCFKGCVHLESIIIPASVIEIGASVFENCTKLSTISLSSPLTSISSYCFANCTNLKSITLPSSLSVIGSWCFHGCTNLSNISSLSKTPPTAYGSAFDGLYETCTVKVPYESVGLYKTADEWNKFKKITTIENPKCATPTIFYGSKRLLFDCDTEGVEYVSEIKVTDGKKYYNNSITLEATYEISVYATKAGYANSDVATATLVWTNAIFTDTTPSPEITTSAKSISENIPVLISSHSGNITVNSEADGQKVEVYAVNGQSLGSAIVKNGLATISTKLGKGSVAIIKIGEKSVKIVMQ